MRMRAPIKDGTVVSYYCVSLWTKKKRLKKCNPWTRIFLTTEKKLSVFIQKLIPAEGTLLQTLLEEKDTYVDLLWLPTY